MRVRLLFECVHKGEQKGWNAENKKMGSVKLAPVYPGNPDYDPALVEEAKAFYAATPGGSAEFSTINNAALDEFEVGEEYYLTIERRRSTAAAAAS